MGSKTYNRRAAADYARKYALHYNPAWPSYSHNIRDDQGRSIARGHGEGDCTNFISQALLAGGLPPQHKYTGFFDSKLIMWFSDGTIRGASRSWASAHRLALYLKDSDRALRITRDQLQLGDVLQLADSEGHVNHSAIVTKIEPAGPNIPVPKVFEDYAGRSFKPVPMGKAYFVSSHDNDRLDFPLTEWERSAADSARRVIYWHINDFIPGT